MGKKEGERERGKADLVSFADHCFLTATLSDTTMEGGEKKRRKRSSFSLPTPLEWP